MTELFDSYDQSYGRVVQSSIDFSGLPHSFFMAAKAECLRDLLARHFGPQPKLAALDVGCGTGTLHPFIRPLFDRLSGLDVSDACVAQARRANPGADYATYAGARLPYADAQFDLSLAVCVLHHVPPPDWPSFLAEMRRVTRPGGLVCVIEHNPFNPLTRLSVARCPFDRDAVLLGAGRMRRLLRDGGLHAVATRHFLLLPSAAAPARRLENLFARVPVGAQYLASGIV